MLQQLERDFWGLPRQASQQGQKKCPEWQVQMCDWMSQGFNLHLCEKAVLYHMQSLSLCTVRVREKVCVRLWVPCVTSFAWVSIYLHGGRNNGCSDVLRWGGEQCEGHRVPLWLAFVSWDVHWGNGRGMDGMMWNALQMPVWLPAMENRHGNAEGRNWSLIFQRPAQHNGKSSWGRWRQASDVVWKHGSSGWGLRNYPL